MRKDWPLLSSPLCLRLTIIVGAVFVVVLTWKNVLDKNSVETRNGENETKKEVNEFICFKI